MRKPLLTDRLLLRDVTITDAELLYHLDADPDVMHYIGPRPAVVVDWYRDRIQTVYIPQQAHPWQGIRLVFDRVSDAFLGWVFVRPAVHARYAREFAWTRLGEEEVGFRYHRAAWGRGIATEAASLLVQIALADPATRAVVGCARTDNLGSLRVLQKLHLVQVGEVSLPEFEQPIRLLTRSNTPIANKSS